MTRSTGWFCRPYALPRKRFAPARSSLQSCNTALASLTCHQSVFIYDCQRLYVLSLAMPSLNLLPDERHRIIRKRLSLGERVLAVEMARELGASEDTIRRDLRELASLGVCQRVYGGALPVSPASGSI